MYVEETFYRPPEMARVSRHIPGQMYNLGRRLVAQGGTDCVFVPIRSMQYLAVLDAEEFIFVHREGRRMIEIAWRDFRPGERRALTDPVAYHAVYYAASATETMARLQVEFYKALQALETKSPSPAGPARVLKLDVGEV